MSALTLPPAPSPQRVSKGFTFIEVLVASAIVALMAGGTMLAFLLAARLSQGASTLGDAGFFAQQTLEKFRNKIACRQTGESGPTPTPPGDTWYDASCAASVPSASPSDVLPAGQLKDRYGGARTYTVTSKDCDGVGGAGDCLEVRVKVTWTQPQ